MKTSYLLAGAIVIGVACFAGGVKWEMIQAAPPAPIHGQILTSSPSSISVLLSTGQSKTFTISPQTSFLGVTQITAKNSSDATVGTTVDIFTDKKGTARVVQFLSESPPVSTSTSAQ